MPVRLLGFFADHRMDLRLELREFHGRPILTFFCHLSTLFTVVYCAVSIHFKGSVMTVTIGDFKAELDKYPDHCELHFSGLDFYRLKRRGDSTVQVEFSQTVYKDKTGRVVVENHE